MLQEKITSFYKRLPNQKSGETFQLLEKAALTIFLKNHMLQEEATLYFGGKLPKLFRKAYLA